MNMTARRVISFLLIAATTFAVVACSKEQEPEPEPTPEYPEIGSVEVYHGSKIGKDMNAIGFISDSDGKGIAGIPVTDGFEYTTTDDNGVYQLAADRNYTRKIYMSLPAEYEVPRNADTQLPQFFSVKEFKGKKLNINDFTLTKLAAIEDNWTFVGIGDPQCQTIAESERYINETITDLQSTMHEYPNVYCMTLGDITHDSSNTWDAMQKSMSNVKCGGKYMYFFQTIGNHDHDSQTATAFASLRRFVANFGPQDYSFNRGKVHIISMDDVMVTKTKQNSSPNKATWEYNAGFTDSQYQWFVQDLATVKDQANKMILLCMHIPMRAGSTSGGSNFNTGNHYKEVLQALAKFKEAHIIIGHTHYPQNYIHTSYVARGGQKIYEHIHDAACGAWWCSNSCVTGGPNSYTIYKIEGASITDWICKPVNRDINYQLRAYDGNTLYDGSKGYKLNWYTAKQTAGPANITVTGNSALKNCFVAEVWDDDDTYWTVEFYQNNTKVGDFKRLANGSCCNVAICNYYFNEKGKNTDTWSNKTASHYWYFKPASGNPSAEKNWYIKATHKIPSSEIVHEFTVGRLTTDNSEF